MIGFLFSGQGAQVVGMGKALYESAPFARELWDKADAQLSHLELKKTCFEGPATALTQTKVCQVGLYVHGYVLYQYLLQTNPELATRRKIGLGLSLGELTALAAAEVYDFETGLRVVAKRAELMQQACEGTHGTMISLIGGSVEEVQALCKRFDVDLANWNSPGQIVISGAIENMESALAGAKQMDFKRAIPLQVAGAYHSRLMQSAAEGFEAFLADIPFKTPAYTVLSNTTGLAVETPQAIKTALVKQVTGTVLWEQCMETALKLGFVNYYECGPGNVLKGLAKRISEEIVVQNSLTTE